MQLRKQAIRRTPTASTDPSGAYLKPLDGIRRHDADFNQDRNLADRRRFRLASSK